jgi:hypothetical protein
MRLLLVSLSIILRKAVAVPASSATGTTWGGTKGTTMVAVSARFETDVPTREALPLNPQENDVTGIYSTPDQKKDT